jgi:metallophosphoesterase superfamily enzyme
VRVHDDWLLTPERAAVHLPTTTAVVADLHLGYAEARRRAGEAVPSVPLETVLAPLEAVFAGRRCRRLVIAGDLFEDAWRPEVAADLLGWLGRRGVGLSAVVPGNHDRHLPSSGLPLAPGGVVLGRWRVVHGDGVLPVGPLVCGHFHPWLRRGPVSAPCYLVGAKRIVLPAFSPDARGVNVCGQPGWRQYRCCAIADGEVLDLGAVAGLRLVKLRQPGRAAGTMRTAPPG